MTSSDIESFGSFKASIHINNCDFEIFAVIFGEPIEVDVITCEICDDDFARSCLFSIDE